MTTVLRAVASAILASLVLVGVALAADPTVGGELAAGGNSVHVTSNGNVPAHVVMSADAVALSVTEFDLQPGETHDLTFTGKAVGTVSATYHAIVTGQETASATLTLNLVAHVPPPPFDPTIPGIAGLLIAATLLLVRRLRPWRWRLVTNPA
jgi:hypothetical protein